MKRERKQVPAVLGLPQSAIGISQASIGAPTDIASVTNAITRGRAEWERQERRNLERIERHASDVQAFWRRHGIEPEIRESKMWVPDWAIDLDNALSGQRRKLGGYIDEVPMIRFLATHHPDAAVAVHIAGGVQSLQDFAVDTWSVHVHGTCTICPLDPPL